MLRFSTSRSFVTLARLLLVAFVQPLLVPLLLAVPSPAVAAPPSVPKTAVLPFSCPESLGGADFGALATKAVTLALVERTGGEVVGLSEVKQALDKAGIIPPYIPSEMQTVGKSLNADRVIRGRIVNLVVKTTAKTATVELRTTTVDVATGEKVAETHATGVARPADAARRTAEELRMEALKDAAHRSVAQLNVLQGLKGIVVSRPTESTARLSLGTESGMQVGTVVDITDHGVKVATGKVVRSDLSVSVIAIEPAAAANRVRVGQRFQAVSTPTPGAVRAVSAEDELSPRSRRKNTQRFLVGLLVAAGLYFLFRNGGGGGAAPAEALTVVADPTSVPADGVTTSTLSIVARDANGNPVPDGTTVSLSTNLGTVTTNVTTSEGKTTATFTADTTPGTASITVTVGAAQKTITIQVGSATTTSGRLSIVVTVVGSQNLVADGNSTSQLEAVVTDEAGNPAPDGTKVYFTSTPSAVGTVTPTATTAGGSATAVFTSGTQAGTARITVKAFLDPNANPLTDTPDGINNLTSIGVSAGPAFQLGVGVDQLNLKALDTVGATNSVNVSVKDANGNPVRDGTVVSFSADKGHVTGTVTTLNGVATGVWTSIASDHLNPPAGIVTITASTTTEGGVLVTDSVQFVVSGDPAFITLTANPSTINISTTTTDPGKSIITATVTDRNGNPVVSGTGVTFATTLGTIDSSAATTGGTRPGEASIAQVTLTAGDTAGTATVTATAGNVQAATTVEMVHP